MVQQEVVTYKRGPNIWRLLGQLRIFYCINTLTTSGQSLEKLGYFLFQNLVILAGFTTFSSPNYAEKKYLTFPIRYYAKSSQILNKTTCSMSNVQLYDRNSQVSWQLEAKCPLITIKLVFEKQVRKEISTK